MEGEREGERRMGLKEELGERWKGGRKEEGREQKVVCGRPGRLSLHLLLFDTEISL